MTNHYAPRTRPFKHQAKATLRLVRRRNHALYIEPRLGKTKAVLDAVGMLAQAGKLRRVLVMGPYLSSAWQQVWEDQIREHYPFTAHCENYEEEWILNPKREGPRVNFYFMHYEKFRTRRRVTHGKRGKLKKPRWTHPFIREVEGWEPQVIVLDESHRLKRAGGVTSQAAWRMVRRLRKRAGRLDDKGPPWVWELSGTANPKGWIDLFAQFRIMDDTIFGTDEASFVGEFVMYGQGPMKYTILRYNNISKILRKVHEHAFTCTAEEAGLAGKQFWQQLRCDLPQKARKAYAEMAEEFITELESGTVVSAANPAVKRLRLLQITGGFTTAGDEIHDEKLRVLSEYTDDLLQQGEPLIVYARFLPEVAAIAKRLERVGYPTKALHGKVHKRDFRNAISQFQRSTRPSALVFQVQVGSLAIELARAAEVVIYSPPDGWENYYQCLQRVMGPNQKRPVRYTHILARGTLDYAVMEALRLKEDMHRVLLKDPRRFLLGMTDEV